MKQFAPRNSRDQERFDKLFPNQEPKNIRVYDNGGRTTDRYTVVFTGRYASRPTRSTQFLSMSANPTYAQGVCIFDSRPGLIDTPSYSHLGKRINYADLPEACREVTADTYLDLHQL